MTDPIIEIRDSEINVEEIMQRIRARIEERRAQAQAQGQNYDALVNEDSTADAGHLPPELYYELRHLQNSINGVWVSLAMRDRKFPIFNSILYRIENLLHRLVVKYVNMLAGRQTAFNRSTVNLLVSLTRGLESQDSKIDTLQKRVAELEEKLSRLESHR